MENSKSVVVGRYLAELDGLRAIAILLVLWWHASDLSAQAGNYDINAFVSYFSLTAIGAQGVTLFFCISGYLITGILIDTSADKNCLKKFYIRRALRIFPLYYLFLILALIFSFVLLKDFEVNQHFFYNLFYIQNWAHFFDSSASPFRGENYYYFGHTWSLAIEEQFYLIWPIMFLCLYKKFQPNVVIAVFLATILGIIVIRIWLSTFIEWDILWTCTVTRMDGLLIGAFIAYVQKEKPHLLNITKNYLIIAFILIFFTVICSFIYSIHYADLFTFMASYGVTLFVILCAISLLFLNGNGGVSKILGHQYLRSIAKISYGLYLYHYPIFRIISANFKDHEINYLEGHLILLFFGSVMTYVIAWLSYNYFEKPILNLKDKFAGYEGNS